MSVARLLDVRHGDGAMSSDQLNQNHYINWVRFLRHCETNSLCTIVASNYGDDGGAGTGEDYHDQANPALDNAFIYAEFDAGVQRFGVLVQWADSVAFGNAPGNPGLSTGSTADGVAIAMAFREDGTSPWAGTTNDDGADTKGATVWTPGGSVVHVFPRSNNPGPPLGSHNTNKENMIRLADDTSLFSRAHWVADANGIFQLFSAADAGDYSAVYLGRYTPRVGLTLAEPYAMIHATALTFWVVGSANIYGSTAGSATREGGIVANVTDGVAFAALNFGGLGSHDVVYQPNNLISPNEFEGAEISIFQRETTLSLAGTLPTDLVFAVYGTTNHNTNLAASYAYIGGSVIATRKWAINWDGGAIPGANNTRIGRLSFS